MADSILFCKNTPVYNIDTEKVYNKALLPGYMADKANNYKFRAWLKLRYSSNTNTLARQLKGITFGQGNRVRINNDTYALSLSDCYWIKKSDNRITFEHVSPYYAEFWRGLGVYQPGTSIPTLYVGGYLNKEWINALTLNKYGNETLIEEECSMLCRLCGIQCAEVIKLPNNSGIAVKNITNPTLMLEQADQSGRIDPDDFDENDIIKHFGIFGLQMIVVDAIFGNGDRHAGNFGWLRNADTGAYVCMAPLYDFDHALDSKRQSDVLMADALNIAKLNSKYTTESVRIANIINNNANNDVFKLRAQYMISKLNKV